MLITRRSIALVVSVCVVVGGAAPGLAGKKRPAKRTIEIRYEGGAVPYAICIDCPKIPSRPGERFVSVEIIDDVAPIGYLDLTWGGRAHGYLSVCGSTEEPQPIPGGVELTAYPWHAPDVPCPNGFSTSGTIRITFSRTPT